MKLLQRSRRDGLRRIRMGLRARRGIALFISMFFVAGIGALALSAIYLTANASLISKSYEKEDDLKYASEAALAIGKASLNFNPAALPNTSYVAMMTNKLVQTADGQAVPNVSVNLWVGQTGSTSGQVGRFASLVSEARDVAGVGFVRRLELAQESFAKYAYWTNSETNNGQVIYFGNGDQIWGPVWSNDNININTTGATFRDQVGTAGTINGAGYGTFIKGYATNQRPINLPSLSTLTSLSGLAAVGGMSFNAPTTGDESTVRLRIEFLAIDLDNNGDSLGANEGFFRVYRANAGQTSWLRGDWPGSLTSAPAKSAVTMCGDWHDTYVAGNPNPVSKFFPASVHSGSVTWFDTVLARGRNVAGNGALTTANLTWARAQGNQTLSTILQNPGARCFLGGDPHLAAITRTAALGYNAAQRNVGGEAQSFTPTDANGAWQLANSTPPAILTARRPNDAQYLFPLHRGFNTNTKGVIYVAGTVGVSGVLRLDRGVTVYTPNTIVLLDDVRYANDPSTVNGQLRQCTDILGLISGGNTVIADNALNSPQTIQSSGSTLMRSLDDTPDMYVHAVSMAIGTSFTVENYNQDPQNVIGCQGTNNARGCLYLTGGIIQNNRGPVGQSNGRGYIKRYSYDRCAAVNPPPYFPTTGRFQDNRYYELDPVRFNVGNLFRSLQQNP